MTTAYIIQISIYLYIYKMTNKAICNASKLKVMS